MDKEEMRKAFEEWAEAFGFGSIKRLPTAPDTNYVERDVTFAWHGWQAAMAHSCEALRNELHRDIMNLPCKYEAAWGSPSPSDWVEGYVNGHRDTRHAAAELALSALSRHGG